MYGYETVAASQTDQVLGDTSAGVTGAGKGQRLHRLIISIATAGANGVVDLKDGSGSAIPIAPASTPVGVHSVEVNAISEIGPWKVTTGSAATVLAVGTFKT